MRTISYLRREEYKALAALTIDGRVLDVGGSTKSGYHELIKGNHEIVTANIDAAYGADVLFDAEEPWPIEHASFSAVLLVNVLEHLYRPHHALQEAYRVLKPGGRIIGVVPFMFNVHGSPNDYFRYTRSALERMCQDAGFVEVRIQELGCGSFGVIYHSLIGFVRIPLLATPLIAVAKACNWLIDTVRPKNRMGSIHMPLGYYFEAVKPD